MHFKQRRFGQLVAVILSLILVFHYRIKCAERMALGLAADRDLAMDTAKAQGKEEGKRKEVEEEEEKERKKRKFEECLNKSVVTQAELDAMGNKGVYALGDIHGELDAVIAELLDKEFIDEDNKWIKPNAYFILKGDFLHRGPKSKEVVTQIIKWKEEAKVLYSRIITLRGNHEEFERIRYLAEELTKNANRDLERKFEKGLSYLERHQHHESFQFGRSKKNPFTSKDEKLHGDTTYSAFLNAQPMAVIVGSDLFMHNIPSKEQLADKLFGNDIEKINKEMKKPLDAENDLTKEEYATIWQWLFNKEFDDDGQEDDFDFTFRTEDKFACTCDDISELLTEFGQANGKIELKRVFIGHMPNGEQQNNRFYCDGKLWMVDTETYWSQQAHVLELSTCEEEAANEEIQRKRKDKEVERKQMLKEFEQAREFMREKGELITE